MHSRRSLRKCEVDDKGRLRTIFTVRLDTAFAHWDSSRIYRVVCKYFPGSPSYYVPVDMIESRKWEGT